MRWYNEDADFDIPGIEQEEEFDSEEMQEAYDRGFRAGYQFGLNESDEDFSDLDESLADFAKKIKNKKFYTALVGDVIDNLKTIVRNTGLDDADAIIEDIKDEPMDSLNPVFSKFSKELKRANETYYKRMKKNGLSESYIGFIYHFCELTGTSISEFVTKTRRDVEKLFDHFKTTAYRFWDEFFAKEAHRRLLQMAI